MQRMIGIAAMVVAIGCGGAPPASSTPGTSPATMAQAGSDMASQPGTGEDEDESTNDLEEHHRHHHHGGFAMFVAMSLDTLGATPEQQPTIAKIQADMHAKMQAAHDAEKVVLLALADGVTAGTIDTAKVDAAVETEKSTSAGIHEAMIDTLNQLHAVLTPMQRSALADKVQAHFDVWRHANDADGAAANDAHGHQLEELAGQLELTADQVSKIDASFAASMRGAAPFDRAQAEQHVNAFAAAFASDTFDAKTLPSAGPANSRVASWGVMRMVRLYEAANPVLTPAQRAKLADELRRHANYKRSETDH